MKPHHKEENGIKMPGNKVNYFAVGTRKVNLKQGGN
jgi:hypothetical protein